MLLASFHNMCLFVSCTIWCNASRSLPGSGSSQASKIRYFPLPQAQVISFHCHTIMTNNSVPLPPYMHLCSGTMFILILCRLVEEKGSVLLLNHLAAAAGVPGKAA